MKGWEVIVNGGLVARCLDKADADRHAKFHKNLSSGTNRRTVVIVRPADWTEREIEAEAAALSGSEVFDGF